MLYRLKLYPDNFSKETARIIEIEADDTELEGMGEGDSTVILSFLVNNEHDKKTCRTVYGVDFSKVIEFYAVDSVKSMNETGKISKPVNSKFTLLEFKQTESK